MIIKNFTPCQKVSYLSEFHEKSLKQLFLKQQKSNLIDQILTILIEQHKLKISQSSIFLLTNFVNYYQMLYKIMNYNSTHVTKYIESYKEEKNKKNSFLPKLVSKQKMIQKPNGLKVFSQSYKSKCFQLFFGLNQFSEQKIVETVVKKIIQKVRKGEIKLLQNYANTSRKVSIFIPNKNFNFKEKQSNFNNQENQKQKQLQKINQENQELNKKQQPIIKNKILNQLTERNKKQKFQLSNLKKINFKSHNSKNQEENNQRQNKKIVQKGFQTYKSVNSVQNRRIGFHQINKISVQICLLKDSFKTKAITNQQLIQLSISIKNRLNILLNSLKVKSVMQKTREKQIKKIR